MQILFAEHHPLDFILQRGIIPALRQNINHQVAGLGKLSPNSVMVGFKQDWKEDPVNIMCLLFHIGETTKICRKIKEKMKIFKIEVKTTKMYRRIKEKMKVLKIEGKTTKM